MPAESPFTYTLPKNAEEGKEIKLHYIGKRFYTIETFTKEALKHGVSRAMPVGIIKKLHWGDKIYVAFEHKDQNGKGALVFGYFYVQGLNVSNPIVSEKLKEDDRIKIVKTVKPGGGSSGSGGGARVSRGCGSYVVASISYVANDVSEIAEVVGDIAKKEGLKVKLMVTGPFTPLAEPIKLYDAPFTRSLVHVKVPNDFFELVRAAPRWVYKPKKKKHSEVAFLKDYQLGKPSKKRKKKIKEMLETKPLTEWVGVGG